MAVVHPDFYRHENLIRKSIQIPSTQHKELKALAVELESSLGDVVETIMELMQQDNFQQLKSAILQKRERTSPLSPTPSMKPTHISVPSQKHSKMLASFLKPAMKSWLRSSVLCKVCFHE